MSSVLGRLRQQFQSLTTQLEPTYPSSPDATLCTTCATLDLKKMLRDGLPEEQKVLLGTFRDISGRRDHCGFCRLVAALIWHRWRLDAFPDAHVHDMDCFVFARACGTLDPEREEEKRTRRLYIGAIRPFDISWTLIAAKAALELELQLLEEDSGKVARPKELHGRRVGERVDPHRIKGWIKLCEKAHKDKCGHVWWKYAHEEVPEFVRMVDVTRMALVPATRMCRYVALSYVWGGPADEYCTSKANVDARCRPNGLNESALPATIVDAIQLTRLIGERYLWIDALCIIQDSLEDKAMQITAMGRVYGRAVVVLVVASGAGVQDGLPGIRAGSRIPNQHIECIQGLHLSIPLPLLSEVVFDSTWNTRGWTFQEGILASRRLYFTKHQLYFECERDIWCEDLAAESKTLKWTAHPMRYSAGVPSYIIDYKDDSMSHRCYENAIEQYSQRNLTFDSDIIVAAMALMDAMTKVLEPAGSVSKEAFRFGMWIRNLDLTLLWQPDLNSTHTRRNMTHGRHVRLPSWAWSGWKGMIHYGDERPMLHGVSVDSDAHGRPVESLITAWSLVDENDTIIRLNVDRIPQSRYTDTPPFKYAACKSHPDDTVLDFVPPIGSLIFRTQCARVRVLKVDDSVLEDPSKATAHTLFHILPMDRVSPQYAGRIVLPVSTASPTVLELIVLSRCHGIPGLWDEGVWGERYFGCILHVMAVQRMHDDPRVDERVGVGVVIESAWVECEPEERIVVLA